MAATVVAIVIIPLLLLLLLLLLPLSPLLMLLRVMLLRAAADATKGKGDAAKGGEKNKFEKIWGLLRKT